MGISDGWKKMDRETELLERIAVRDDIFGGKPIIGGMRFAVEHVLELLAFGMTVEEILHQYPILELEDIQACCLFAYLAVSGDEIYEEMIVRRVT